MGAWGLKSFENDDALDWVAAFDEGGAPAVIEALQAAIEASRDEDFGLEAPEASQGLAAAEIVAAARHGDRSRLPEAASRTLDKCVDELATGEHIELAKEAVQLVMSKSELRELWEETEEFDNWLADVERLAKQLAQDKT